MRRWIWLSGAAVQGCRSAGWGVPVATGRKATLYLTDEIATRVAPGHSLGATSPNPWLTISGAELLDSLLTRKNSLNRWILRSYYGHPKHDSLMSVRARASRSRDTIAITLTTSELGCR